MRAGAGMIQEGANLIRDGRRPERLNAECILVQAIFIQAEGLIEEALGEAVPPD